MQSVRLASRARSQVENSGLSDYASMGLVFAVSALVAAQDGRVEKAREEMRRATTLSGQLVDFPVWLEGEARLVQARAALRLDDVTSAQALLADVSRLLQRMPDGPVLHDWLREMSAGVSGAAGGERVGLTGAEVRILQFLPTHLSFPEVAEQLCVSPNTVKTQAQAVYRKLGAGTRAEAVDLARQGGLLDSTAADRQPVA